MKKFFLLLLVAAGFAIASTAQTIRNNTDCDIVYNIICYTGNPCLPPNPVPPGALLPSNSTVAYSLCPGGPAFTIFHFYFDRGCNTNDPY
ncbi:MAG TPA: hypothetical protein PL009_07640 [Flavipsychrobacter sp.]|nr:hypothetical protein [Flavipsychrobacter sp.]